MNVNPSSVSNHDTWLMASWIMGDEEAFNGWTAGVKAASAKGLDQLDERIAKALRHHYDLRMEKEIPGPGIFFDLVSAAMRRIEWVEIAHILIDNMEISDDQ